MSETITVRLVLDTTEFDAQIARVREALQGLQSQAAHATGHTVVRLNDAELNEDERIRSQVLHHYRDNGTVGS